MGRLLITLLCCLRLGTALLEAGSPADQSAATRITILYDNTSQVEASEADWGFACLIEAGGARILFDTGTHDGVLRHNLEALAVDLSGIDAIVLSHDHGDHTGGLFAVLAKLQADKVPVFVPASFPADFDRQVAGAGGKVIRVSDPIEIVPGIHSTGEIGDRIHEQAVVIATKAGNVVLTGCAHPGVVNMVEAANRATGKQASTVLGGFHLFKASVAEVTTIIEQLKGFGVTRCGATHCSGEVAIATFRDAFDESFITLGVGAVVTLDSTRDDSAPS